jgi:hypothetical protein
MVRHRPGGAQPARKGAETGGLCPCRLAAIHALPANLCLKQRRSSREFLQFGGEKGGGSEEGRGRRRWEQLV